MAWPVLRVINGWGLALACALLWHACGGLLPWLLGPMLGFALGRAVGLPLADWAWGRALGQCVVGVALGLRFTPEVMHGLADRGALLLLLAVLALSPAAVGAWAYQRWAGLNRPTAWLCALPGGASEMAVLAERHGLPVGPVALTQGWRVALVVSLVPWAVLGWLEPSAQAAVQPDGAVAGLVGSPTWLDWRMWLLTAAWVLLLAGPAWFLQRWRVPNVWLMWPMVATALFIQLSPSSALAVPDQALDAAQLLLGITLGARMELTAWRLAPRLSLVCAGVVAASLVGVCVVSVGLAWWQSGLGVGSRNAQVLTQALTHGLALAPGGIAEMSLLARQVGAFLPEVIATHALRLVLILALSPGWLARLCRLHRPPL